VFEQEHPVLGMPEYVLEEDEMAEREMVTGVYDDLWQAFRDARGNP